MKTNLHKLLFLLVSITFMHGCSSNDDNNNNDEGFYMRAKIDGVPFEVTGELLCTYANIVTFNIQANKQGAQEGITLTLFPNNISTQTYNMQQTSNVQISGQYYLNDDSYATIQNPNGSITITEYDPNAKIIKGSFSFIGKHLSNNTTKNITEGSFRCKGLN